jgi:hypothetical protein
VVNLNSNPAERRHGTQVKEGTFMASPRTNNLLTNLSKEITPDMIKSVGHNLWDVESRTRGFMLAHRVNWIGTRYICTCEWAVNHPNRECAHAKAVGDLVSAQFAPEPTQSPKPKPKIQLEDLYDWVDSVA